MKAKSITGKSTAEIQSELSRVLSDGFKPTLAIVFISIKQDRNSVCEILQKQGIDVIGATSCGNFINGCQNGYEEDGSTVILLLDLNPKYYTLIFEEIGDRKLDEVAVKLAGDALQIFKKPAFILCSTGLSMKGNFFNGELLVRSMESVVGRNTKIFGGMAGDDVSFTGTFVLFIGSFILMLIRCNSSLRRLLLSIKMENYILYIAIGEKEEQEHD